MENGKKMKIHENTSVLCTKEKNILINFVSDATERFVLFCFAVLFFVFASGMSRYNL